MRVAVEARVAREAHTPLDGTFLAWANPPAGADTGGDYPFVFDCPDAATHHAMTLPAIVNAQIAAFAQQVTVYESRRSTTPRKRAQGLSFGSRSFIPSGLISPSGEPVIRRNRTRSSPAKSSKRRSAATPSPESRSGGRSSTPSAAPSTSSSIPRCCSTRRSMPATSSPAGSGCQDGCRRPRRQAAAGSES